MTAATDAVREADAPDQAFCAAILPAVSRTFAASIETLPESLRDAVRVAYLLCRIVDTIEDEAGLAPARRQALFEAFDAQMGADATDPAAFESAAAGVGRDADGTLLRGAGAAFRSFRALPAVTRSAIRPSVLAMSRGMREYAARADAAGHLALADLDDLERYCYFVAGTVGELLTALFEQTTPPLPPAAAEIVRTAAIPFGLGLQMVNIVKDVAADATRGACFLPDAILERHGVTRATLLDPASREAALAAVHDVCERARDHLERAVEYTLAWPLPEGALVRRFCAVPLALAFATLREVERGDDALRPGRTPKVSRATVLQLMTAAGAAVHDDSDLDRLLRLHR